MARPDGGGQEDRDWQRLDKWLWCARFMKARSDCAALVGHGAIRINRQATDKAHARLRVGDVLTIPVRGAVRVVAVLALAQRRGPASEARTLYQEMAWDDAPAAPAGAEPDPAAEFSGVHRPEAARPDQACSDSSCAEADSSAYRRL